MVSWASLVFCGFGGCLMVWFGFLAVDWFGWVDDCGLICWFLSLCAGLGGRSRMLLLVVA